MKRGVVLVFVLASVLAGSAPVKAATIRKWSVEPSVQGGEVKTDAALKVNNAYQKGVSLGFVIHPAFEVEIYKHSFDTQSSFLNRPDDDYKQELKGIRLIGIFRGSDDTRTKPFLYAGGGRITTTGDRGGNRQVFTYDASFGELGMGTHIFLWKDLDIRTELGLQHSRTIDIAGRPKTHANWHLTLGLSYFFFGAK